MNAYEEMRKELLLNLNNTIPPECIQKVVAQIDVLFERYDIEKKKTDLIQTNTVPDVVKYFIAAKSVQNLSRKTLYIYGKKLIHMFSCINKCYTDITTNDIRLYLYRLKQDRNNSDNTLDNTRRVLNSFFDWLLVNEYIQRNPVKNVDKIKYHDKERTALSPVQLEELRWHCQGCREKALVDFLYSTGMRAGELVQVTLADIDWREKSVRIHHGKGDKPRIVFFNAEAEVSVKKYLETRTDSDVHLFVSDRNPHNGLSVRGIELIIKHIAMRCQQSQTTPHVLRHTFATSGLRNGIPLQQLQTLMGHAKPETTMIYAKVDYSDIRYSHQHAFSN